MQLNTALRETRTGGLMEATAFKVEMNSMLFHSVIDGIYADKIRAPFRELTTNARDGHAAKGNLDQPFDVFLPSILDPTFKVRDYGISLSHEEIMGIYSTMFASTKRDTNSAVGMIGLGSKSPFAYTSVFTVMAFLGGYKRTYSAFIGEDGVPQIALLDMCETGEPDGIEVSFPVKAEDVNKFRGAAPDVLFGFDPFPNILNEQFTRPEPTILYQGDGWTLYDAKTVPFGSKLMARQGCVLYPISKTSVGSDSNLFDWPVVIDFPIGDLSVATSREALGYDSRTVANIKKRIEDTTEGMTALVSAEINACDSYLKACQLLADGLVYGNPKQQLFKLIGSRLTWGGAVLRSQIKCALSHPGANGYLMSSERVMMGTIRKTVSHRTLALRDLTMDPKVVEDLLIYVEFEGCKQSNARMRQAILDNTNDQDILWIRADSIDKLEPYISQLGNPEWIDLATLAPLKAEKAAKTQARTLQYMSPTSSVHRQWALSAMYETVTPTDGMIYVRQEGNDFWIGTGNYGKVSLHNAINDLMKAGVLDRGTKVWFLNKANMKLLDEVNMIELSDHVRKRLPTLVDIKSIRAPESSWVKTNRDHNSRKIMAYAETIKVPEQILKVVKRVLADKRAPVAGDSPLLGCFQRYLPAEYAKATANGDPIIKAYNQMVEEFPLLTDVINTTPKFEHYMELLNK